MVLYEYPFNESIRTMLRLEHLFGRLWTLVARDEALDHHFALATMFEIVDVAARADLKSDLLKDLDRQRSQLETYRGNPQISEQALDGIVTRVEQAHTALNGLSGKAGHALGNNEWLMSVRSRISIPGGTCEFDLPSYYAWQHRGTEQRREDLRRWAASLVPLDQALTVLLGLLRETGSAQRVLAPQGNYQQSLAPGRSYQLMRVRLDPSDELVPEITGHRLMLGVRLMRSEPDGRLRPAGRDASFELTLCA